MLLAAVFSLSSGSGPRNATGVTGAAPAQPAGPCDESPPGALAPSADLYCLRLVASPGIEGAIGSVELRRRPGPFSVSVSDGGHHVYELGFLLKGLPDPASLGDYTTFVAWAATPLLYPIVKLGEVQNGSFDLGPIAFDKFLILVSAERSADGEERTGRLVLRGQSPSTRMKPADFVEFFLGAAPLEEAAPRPDPADELERGDPAPVTWGAHPVPEGVTMLPALMRLRPEAVPFLPSPALEEIAFARPRRLVPLEDGDTLDLSAEFVRRRVGGRELLMYGFNGQHPGPLIHVEQDAEITVRFVNRIDLPTAVHWHGVRLDNRSDGVPGVTQDPIPPGASFIYTIHFRDAGIYWYHPHHREDIQQDLGLYGNMLVRSALPDYYGPAHREEVLMLDDILIGDAGLVPYGRDGPTHSLMGRFGNVFLVNGEPDYRLEANRGEVVRFFFTNVSNTRTFNLSFGGVPMKLVGTDVGNYEREAWVESVPIGPAERYILHVRFPEAGSYPLLNRVQAIDHVNGTYFPQEDTLARIAVSSERVETDLAESFATLREQRHVTGEIDGFRQYFERPADKRLVLDMEVRGLPLIVERLMKLDSAYFTPVEWSGTMPAMNWIATPEEVRWILRDPDSGAENEAIDWAFEVDDVVKIRISNHRGAFHAMQHPIHLHGQRFLVLAQDGRPNDNLAWKDTAVVPVGSTVDLLLEVSNPGRWMLHCHIAEHLDAGMRMVFTVH